MNLPKGLNNETNADCDFNETSLKNNVDVFPLNSGGSNFKTHTLLSVSPSKMIYKPSIGMALFAFIFLAAGLSIMFFSVTPFFNDITDGSSKKWFLFLFGSIFALAGGFMFYSFYMPRVFDKQLDLYYKTHRFKLHHKNTPKSSDYISLSAIIAIQIIGEHIKGDKGSYNSFELNLVLKDSSRKNVVDHGNLKSIINDAHILSDFLNIPIWHAKSKDT